MNAKQAMARSASHNEIVVLDAYSATDHETLSEACDGHVLANGVYEFWAHAEYEPDELCKRHGVRRAECDDAHDEMAWRVHMPKP